MLETNRKSFREELVTSWDVCKRNTGGLYFFWPMCWAVNYYNIYQSNDFNGVYFTVRGRALNTFISGAVQIPSAWILNIFTDKLPFGRRKRAFIAIIYVFIGINAVWTGGYIMMKRTVYGLREADRVDVFDSGYAGACAVYVLYGFTDATYNCYAYWFIGALSNRPEEVGHQFFFTYYLQIVAFTNDLYSSLFMHLCTDSSTPCVRYAPTRST